MKMIKTRGVSIPRLGFGTFRMPGAESQLVVESAIALGFRHIDTAAMYENETAVGATLAASGVKREELFVTTKACTANSRPMPCTGRSTSAAASSGSIIWTST
jgi:2,5-diketo-D-gluconate reductase B